MVRRSGHRHQPHLRYSPRRSHVSVERPDAVVCYGKRGKSFLKTTVNIFAFFFILFSSLFLTCRDRGSEPPPLQPGRRDYDWSIDTLKVQIGDQIILSSLWGSSPTNVWAVGSSDASWNTIWHYDGISWQRDSLQRQISPRSVYGFASNNIWICSSYGDRYWHYDGSSWNENNHYVVSGFPLVGLIDLWGKNSNNIYSVGFASTSDGSSYKGIVMHFNGFSWDFIPILDQRVEFTSIMSTQAESSKYYLSGVRFEAIGDTNKLFEFDGSTMKEIYSSATHLATVNKVNEKMYFCIGRKIFFYENEQFKLWKDFTETPFRGQMWGRSDIDFFSVTSDGIGHFNGTDLVTIYPIDALIFDMAVFETDIFVLCLTKSLDHPVVYHGVLQ